ncbi:MlaD family protein [Rhizorhapis sp. SPR117]|uniref:MlaD family protein n=1 Tax=Rhizorhapis sp. SPR117 TaxID=2912611 RepID=UPI001F2C766B|nr:MlaD family protein [Rhizorhapis sp. SPR117]
MERHANYALVGAVSIVLLIATVVFVVWLGGSQFRREHDPYQIVFHGPIRGLSVGGEVQFNGIKVGEIGEIRLDQRDPNRVITDIELTRGTPVRIDSVASTETQGISGISIVQISAGTASKPLLQSVSRSKRPVITSKPNALSSLLQGGGEMVASATQALNSVNKLLSDRNIANVGSAIQDIRVTTAELAANRAMFANAGSALAKLDRAASDIQDAASSVRQIADGDGKRAFANISVAANELKGAVHEARGVIAKLDRQSADIGTTTLPNINATMISLQDTAESLDGLIRQIQRDPRHALGKGSGRERELPQ